MAILNSKRSDTYTTTTTRKTTRANSALRETVPPHLEPTDSLETCSAPVTRPSLARTSATWSAESSSVWTTTCTGWSCSCTTLATPPRASRTWASVTGLVASARNTDPPLKSMPNLRPGTNRETSEMSMTTPDSTAQRRHRPTKSIETSPW